MVGAARVDVELDMSWADVWRQLSLEGITEVQSSRFYEILDEIQVGMKRRKPTLDLINKVRDGLRFRQATRGRQALRNALEKKRVINAINAHVDPKHPGYISGSALFRLCNVYGAIGERTLKSHGARRVVGNDRKRKIYYTREQAKDIVIGVTLNKVARVAGIEFND